MGPRLGSPCCCFCDNEKETCRNVCVGSQDDFTSMVAQFLVVLNNKTLQYFQLDLYF